MDPNVPFSRLALIGVGYIGGSAALAARRAGLVGSVTGYDVDAQAGPLARARGVVDDMAESAEEAGTDAGAAGHAPAGSPPVVILYGTPWCGACKAARQYLASKHIPFAYRDIENDASAARELQRKASRLGIPADRVPILDVRGRLLVGFDRTRLEALLGDAT